ncbi:MAG: nucleotidyltransferase family protein [Brasilonema angustatum HA4187-MV1]|jgi:hypothetical protein|nr:nucleotidyltransferase family protein [Brasilonema angustatum HA4187-MV1]
MRRDEVLTILQQHWTVLKNFGVRSLSIFGSVARDEARSDSDVDILVELEPPLTFDRYMEIKFYLEDQLGTQVDLVSWRLPTAELRLTLKPSIRDVVEKEAIRVA